MNLNESQMIASEHFKNPMMVLAGPGSGKTTVITFRVKTLIEKYNVSPSKILVITFTKSAAEEMKMRFENMSSVKQVKFCTFHAFFFRIIRSYYRFESANILSPHEQTLILQEIVNTLGINEEGSKDFLDNVLLEISMLKNELLDIQYYYSSVMGAQDFKRVFNAYEEKKREYHKIDFDDMLKICFDLLSNESEILEYWQKRYEFILIDEFQDINKAQYECIKLLSQHRNLFVVGDDDQRCEVFLSEKLRLIG